jgi:hypothetical protein
MPLIFTEFQNLSKGVGTAYKDGNADRLFFVCFQELAKTYATCDLVEEFCGEKVLPVCVGWSVVA